ncbi:hypothetical protein [Pseudomonas xionganensis]|uniref:Uncharacterized protein n=1 Tax=Pseudomonas xionganensis TaxID=2654845 RepID=A0A6I4L5E8_9PSED|nr:hypothetical protein [Pseudomonas xionganensis]MVW77203.1 hypothetical protein [Pseudomonas xionganensis]
MSLFRVGRDWVARVGDVFQPEPGSMYFWLVEKEYALPWFHLRLEVKADDGVYYSQMMPSGVEEFERLMKSADLDERILSVDAQVMLPPHMTGSDGWTLQRLVALHEVDANWFFTVDSGAVYRDGDGDVVTLDSVQHPRLIYSRL